MGDYDMGKDPPQVVIMIRFITEIFNQVLMVHVVTHGVDFQS